MSTLRSTVFLLLFFTAILPMQAAAERRCLPDDAVPEEWTMPYPAHRVIGNLYAVGMTDLSVFLITTPDGHILINTGLADRYRRQKAMEVDVWVAAHGSQYGLLEKHQPGQAYDPDTFVDPAGFLMEVSRLESIYRAQLESEGQ